MKKMRNEATSSAMLHLVWTSDVLYYDHSAACSHGSPFPRERNGEGRCPHPHAIHCGAHFILGIAMA